MSGQVQACEIPRELLWQGTDLSTGGRFCLRFTVEKPLDPALFDIAEKLLALARDGMTGVLALAATASKPEGGGEAL